MRYFTSGNLAKLKTILIQRGYSWYEAEDIALRILSVSSKKDGASVEVLIEQLPAPKQRSPSKLIWKRKMKRLYAAANPEKWKQYTTFADVPGVLLINRNAERSRVLPFPTFCTQEANMGALLEFVARNSTSPTTA